MKTRLIIALMAAAVATPALAQVTYTERITVYDERAYDAFVREERGAIHSGANNLNDLLLADQVAMALAKDRRLDGSTMTVSANNGQVSLSGSAKSPEQGEVAQQVAKRVAGNVTGTLDSQGA